MPAISLLTSLPVEFPHIPLLETLPPQDLEALVAHVGLADAVVAAAALVHHRQVTAVESVDEWDGGSETSHLLLIRNGDAFYSKWFSHAMQREWESARRQDTDHMFVLDPLEARRAYLHGAMNRLLAYSRDMATVLQNRWLARPDHTVFANAVTGLWWQARMADGCTPETARMLLGLIVTAPLLRLLDFPADGTAPTVIPLSPAPDGPRMLAGSASRRPI